MQRTNLPTPKANFGRCGTNTRQSRPPPPTPLCSGRQVLLLSVAGIVLVSLLWATPVQKDREEGAGWLHGGRLTTRESRIRLWSLGPSLHVFLPLIVADIGSEAFLPPVALHLVAF